MAIEPGELLEFAKAMAAATSEAEMRAAVSRSYYAAFHTLERIVGACCKDFTPREGQTCLDHSDVGRALRNWQSVAEPKKLAMAFGARAGSIADHFFRCKSEREDADYELAKDYVPEIVAAHMKRISKLFSFATDANKQLSRGGC